jgi:hypothetical protein
MAAILFPVFARARENARRSTCQSNLKQLGLAFQQYLQDYDERFIPYLADAPPPEQSPWFRLNPYVKNDQIWICPSDALHNQNRNSYKHSYGYNQLLCYPNIGKLAGLQYPAECFLFRETYNADYFNATACYRGNTSHTEFMEPVGALTNGGWQYPHFDGGDSVFVDGHVKWTKKDKYSIPMFGTTWASTFSSASSDVKHYCYGRDDSPQ